MFDEMKIAQAKNWLRIYERYNNGIPADKNTTEGSAYYIIASLVSEGEEINDVLKGKNV